MSTPERSTTTVAALLLFALLAAGCSGSDEGSAAAGGTGDGAAGEPEAAATPEQPRLPDAELGEFEREDLGLTLPWTNGRISREPPEEERPSPLRELSFSQVETLDRVVFSFDPDDAFPGYVVESTLGSLPGCEAGDPVTARGEGLLRITLSNASADPEVAGEPVRRPDLDNVDAVHRCSRDEGTVEWILDVRRTTTYRVLRASDPPRLAVDVRHDLERTSRQR